MSSKRDSSLVVLAPINMVSDVSIARITARRALIDADYPPRRSRWRIVATWVAIGLVFWLWEVSK